MANKILKYKDLNQGNILLRENEELSLILTDVSGDLFFDLAPNSYLKLSLIVNQENNSHINGIIKQNAKVDVYYVDFSPFNNKLVTDIHLKESNSSINWRLACLSKLESKKEFEVSIYHDATATSSRIDNYGVCKDASKLVFSGICKIEEGSHQSKAHQTAKIMVFDDNADAIAKPILKIDDNEIEASHAATVGKISDDELFYLTSRGISIEHARELITYGYLKPIIAGFDDEEIASYLTQEIEGSL